MQIATRRCFTALNMTDYSKFNQDCFVADLIALTGKEIVILSWVAKDLLDTECYQKMFRCAQHDKIPLRFQAMSGNQFWPQLP